MSAPVSYDEAEANRRLRAALAVVDAARAMLHDVDDEHWTRPLRFVRLADTLAAYDAATADPVSTYLTNTP